jgi:hypothetical protein
MPFSIRVPSLITPVHCITQTEEPFIVSHPACVQNPEWYALARQAAEALHILYQKVGAAHLKGD